MNTFLRNSFYLIAGCLLGVAAYAQPNGISVTQPPYNGVCGGVPLKLPIATTGTFGADNVFTVQLMGGNPNAPTYQNLPTKGTGNPLEIILPDTISPGPYRLRVLASNPGTTGVPSTYFYPQRKPTARIVERPLTIAPYESVGIPIQLSGSELGASSAYRVTINDSLVVGNGESFAAYPGNKTTTYRVTKVENACGVGTASGQQTVVVAPFGLRLTTIAPETACPGAVVQLGFSANGTFESGNRFIVQVTNEKGEYVDLPTKGDASPLSVTLPASVPEGWGNYVRIASTAPALVSNVLGGTYNFRALRLYPTPSATLETDVKAVPYGGTATLVVRLTGHNTQCTLSDGTRLEYNGSGNYQPEPGRFEVTVNPTESTTYTIRSATGACGPVATTGTARVEVTNGIIAGKLVDERPCVGQPIRVPIRTNAQFTAQTTFQVQIGYSATGGILLPATLKNDTLVATLTAEALGVAPGLDGSYYVGSEVRVITQNPAIVSTASPSRFEVGYVPLVANLNVSTLRSGGTWETANQPVLDRPEPIRVVADAKSNLPLTIKLTDGSRQWQLATAAPRYSGDYPLVVLSDRPLQTTTYAMSEISNACGTRRFTDKSKQVVVRQPGSQTIRVNDLPGRIFCAGETVSMPFETTGGVADSVRYRVTLYGYSIYGYSAVAPVVVGRSSASPVSVTLPTVQSAGTYTLRIEAENAPISSRDIFLTLHKKPVATLLPGPTDLLAGETTTLLVEAKGGGPYTLLTAGGESFAVPNYDANSATLDGRVSIPVRPAQTTTYRLTSIANACGTEPVADERTIRVVPYRLYITNPGNSGYNEVTTLEQKTPTCRGGLLTVPYATIGSVPADESFEVQVAKGPGLMFETLPLESAGNPLVARLPDSYVAEPYGTYKVRVMGRKTGTYSHTSPGFRVGEPPTATLSLATGSPSVADPFVVLQVKVTNGDNFTTWGIRNYEPNYTGSSAVPPAGLVVLPRRQTTYSLAYVRNACGYGTTSGEVTVTVKPTLTITAPSPGSQLLTCAGKSLTVGYNTTGDWTNGIDVVAELAGIGINSAYTRELGRGTARQGNLSLTMPADLVPGEYSLRLRSANPDLTASLSLRVAAPVTAQLTGNLVINPGQRIVIRPVITGTFPVDYQLSTGALGTWSTDTPSFELAPVRSGTYSLTSVSNVCGSGSVSGSLTVTVNPASARTLTTDRVSGRLCGGDTVLVDYTGVGLADSPLVVQLSDRTGDNYAPLPTTGRASPLRVALPVGLPAGGNYRFRVTSPDPAVASSVLLTPVTILEKATASVVGPPYVELGKPATVTVTVTGSVPVSLTLGPDGSSPWTWQVGSSVFPVSVSAALLPTTFRLLAVQNACGPGRIEGGGVVRLELLTANEPIGLALRVWPNPVGQLVYVDNLPITGKPVTVELLSVDGRPIRTRTFPPLSAVSMPIGDLPGGIYLLRINLNQTTVTYRLIKL